MTNVKFFVQFTGQICQFHYLTMSQIFAVFVTKKPLQRRHVRGWKTHTKTKTSKIPFATHP
jgi:hypothetical protein